MTRQTPSHPKVGYRTAGIVTAFATTLTAAVLLALACGPGTGVSAARETEVALRPALELPLTQALVGAAGTGTFTGTIVLDGDVPQLTPAASKNDPTVKDPQVCLANGDVPNESLVVDPKSKGIKNVFVYLAKAPEGAAGAKGPGLPIDFDQQNCRFLPHALLVHAPVTVLVKSNDGVPHNTRTSPLRNDAFNQTIPANDRKGVELKYKKPERLPVEVKCDFHPWMKAYHLVLDHPYMAVTDENGKFTISDLPAGKHEFIIWQEKKGYLNKKYEVEIKAGETKEVSLKYKASDFAMFEGPRPSSIAVSVAP
ncbi:MAG: SpaA isopeptide-forming pilin-related protein [Planctomycetaceae bacterium]